MSIYAETNITIRSKFDPRVTADLPLYTVKGTLVGHVPSATKDICDYAEYCQIQLSNATKENSKVPIKIIISEDLYVRHFALKNTESHMFGDGLAFFDTILMHA